MKWFIKVPRGSFLIKILGKSLQRLQPLFLGGVLNTGRDAVLLGNYSQNRDRQCTSTHIFVSFNRG